jgi:hypothetical protein
MEPVPQKCPVYWMRESFFGGYTIPVCLLFINAVHDDHLANAEVSGRPDLWLIRYCIGYFSSSIPILAHSSSNQGGKGAFGLRIPGTILK